MQPIVKSPRLGQAIGMVMVLLLFGVGIPAGAMDKELMPGYLFRSWDIDDGMPSTHVNAVARTADGFVWLATAKGLARFDGQHFVTFDYSRARTVDDSTFTSLLVDQEGTLWAGNAAGMLLKLSHRQLVDADQIGLSPPRPALLSLAQDTAGSIWMATDGAGLISRSRQGTNSFHMRDGLPSERLSKVLCDTNGGVWVLGADRLATFQQGHWLRPPALPTTIQDIQAIAPSRDGGLWVSAIPASPGKRGDPVVLKLKGNQCTNELSATPWPGTLPNARITALLEDEAGRLWCGTDRYGVVLYEPGRGWRQLASDPSISRLEILCLAQDEANSVWIGTRTAGIQQVRPGLLSALQLPPENTIVSACASRDGSIWGGTDSAGVYRWQGEVVTHFGTGQGLADPHIYALLEDRHTNLWASTTGGVFRFDGRQFQAVTDPPAMKTATFGIFEDREGNVWFGTRQGLVEWHEGQGVLWGTTTGLPAHSVVAMSEDRQGQLWVSVPGLGLFHQNGDHFTHYQPINRADHSPLNDWYDATSIRAILCDDRDDSVWIATQGFGLERVQDGVIDQWKWPDDGLPSNHQFALMQDDNHNLWISSENGIFGYAENALTHYPRGQNLPLVPWRLTRSEGLPDKVCSGLGQPTATKGPDGRFWFPDGSTLVAFDPAMVSREEKNWPVTIESVVVDGVPLPMTDDATVRVKSGARTFQIQFTSPDILSSERLRFRYELENLDRDWIEAGNTRTAYYNRLPPGQYRFRVTSSGSDQPRLEAAATLTLVVVPRFYERRSLQITGAVIVLMLFAAIIWRIERARSRRRLEQLRLQYVLVNERQRIARDIHDELGSGLTQIILLSDNLNGEIRQLPATEKMVSEIGTCARSLTRAMDEVVWAVNPRNDSLEGFMTYLNKYSQEYLTRAGVACRWDVPLDLPVVPLSAETRHSLFLACKESLNNIVKHAGASEVWIRLELAARDFCLTIEDNGRGFQPDGPGAGNGLINTRQRLHELKGRCQVTSAPGKGTRIQLIVPIGRVTEPAAPVATE